jgi:hypothetical protein
MKLTKYYSIFFPLLLTASVLLVSVLYLYPFFLDQFSKNRELISLFREKDNSVDIKKKIALYQNNSQKLIQLIASLDSTGVRNTSMIDSLYGFSGTAGFKLTKVETGQAVTIEKTRETPYLIQGKGSFASIGLFILQIENSKKSTRVRQIVMNNAENGQIETMIEFVTIGE